MQFALMTEPQEGFQRTTRDDLGRTRGSSSDRTTDERDAMSPSA